MTAKVLATPFSHSQFTVNSLFTLLDTYIRVNNNNIL